MIDFNKREKPVPSDWKMKHYTISRKANKYYCSICFEYENPLIHKGLNFIRLDESKYIGLDYKSDGLYIDSNGQCAEYPKYYRQSQRKLRMLQKKYSRQQKGGKNNEKTLLKIQKLHEHISNQRKDFLHKLSTAITKQYDVICVEDIDMKGLSQTLHLGKSTLDNGFGMFRLMLTYKALRQPMKYLIKVDRFFASSKTCSHCGYKLDELKLSDRVFNCPKCKHSIDRDFNAAINIRD
jgi:putative transposase